MQAGTRSEPPIVRRLIPSKSSASPEVSLTRADTHHFIMASLAARHPLLKEHPCPPNHCTGRSMVPCASSIGSMRSIGSISILSASSNCRSRALKRSVAFPTSSRRYQSSPGNHNGSRLSAKIRTRSFPCRVRAAADGADSPVAEEAQVDGEAFKKAVESQKHSELLNRIASGEFTVASKR